MIVIQNKLANAFLMKGYAAVTLWPFVFVHTDAKVTERILNHEAIHGRQQMELLVVPFFLLYVGEWLVRLCIEPKGWAYFNLSFEREARYYELRPSERRPFGWINFYN